MASSLGPNDPAPLLVTEQQRQQILGLLKRRYVGDGVNVNVAPDGGTVAFSAGRRKAGGAPSVTNLTPVDVEKTSGSAGSGTTQCAFKYTMKARGSSAVIATDLTPICKRPTVGKMVEATHGLAIGNLLYWCDEQPAKKKCGT